MVHATDDDDDAIFGQPPPGFVTYSLNFKPQCELESREPTKPEPVSVADPSWFDDVPYDTCATVTDVPSDTTIHPTVSRMPLLPWLCVDQPFLEEAAMMALRSYNSKHQCQFELVHPLYMENIVIPSKSRLSYPMSTYNHVSFVARSKDSSGKLKLFFGEVLDHRTVTVCTPVEPGNPLFPVGCGKCHPKGVIFHPFNKYVAGDRLYHDSPRPYELTKLEGYTKELLGGMYTFRDVVVELSPGEDKELREITYSCAVRALAWYNYYKRCAFELLEIVACVRLGDDSTFTSYLHCNVFAHVTFKAKNTDPRCIDASAEMFFAELTLEHGRVTTCVNLTANACLLRSEAETSCKVCREYCPMFHPIGEYKGIKYEAGVTGGTFADAQVKGRSWGAKVELQEKLDTSSREPRFIGLSSVFAPKQSGVVSAPRKVMNQSGVVSAPRKVMNRQAFSTNCIKT